MRPPKKKRKKRKKRTTVPGKRKEIGRRDVHPTTGSTSETGVRFYCLR
jgi:hypothetical protein